MALDHNTFLTDFNGGSVTIDPAVPSFTILTTAGSTNGGNAYGPAPFLLEDKHVVKFRRNVIAADWWDDDFTDGQCVLYLGYDAAPADITFQTYSWGYRRPNIPGGHIVINFREIPSRQPRVSATGSTPVLMTEVSPFVAGDFDGTFENTLTIDFMVPGEVTVILTSESGAEYTATLSGHTIVFGNDSSFVWHLHDYKGGNTEEILDFDVASGIAPIENLAVGDSFDLSWSAVANAVRYQLLVNGGGPKTLNNGFYYGLPPTNLLLPLTDENGTGLFVDQSPDARAVTLNGDPSADAAVFKWYASSVDFDGNDALTLPMILDGTTWTVEMWVYPKDLSGLATIWQQYSGSSNAGRTILALSADTLQFFQNGSWSIGGVLTLNTWHHVAAVCNEGELQVYLDGQLNFSRSGVLAPENTNFRIGGTWNYFTGNMQDVRVYKDIAMYSGNFTPPGAFFDPATGTVL